jgi:uncharacterized membrane protein YeaQ/YmgE (transglycosylase-associated protein family)
MLLAYMLSVVVSGLIVGGIARAVIPGHQQMGLGSTIGLGVLGSIVGGTIGGLIFRRGGGRFLGLILAVAAAAVLLRFAIKKGWVRNASA